MLKRLSVVLVLLAVVCAAVPLGAETTGTLVSATSTVTNTTLPYNTQSVTIINEGADPVYWRLFGSKETPADAVATGGAYLKIGESITFQFQRGSNDNAGLPGYYSTVSLICGAAKTATVRLISK